MKESDFDVIEEGDLFEEEPKKKKKSKKKGRKEASVADAIP